MLQFKLFLFHRKKKFTSPPIVWKKITFCFFSLLKEKCVKKLFFLKKKEKYVTWFGKKVSLVM